ncbi:hypothetical protein KFE98_05120 [bacterium SCSIO 12741]|nr:hypothetical protein KFE98_05120 [bacterium SCSIO 12741]
MKNSIKMALACTALGLAGIQTLHAQSNSLNPFGNVGIGTSTPNHLLEARDTMAHPHHGGAPAFLFEETYYTNSTNTSPVGTEHPVFEIRQQGIYDTYPNSSTSSPATLDNVILSAWGNLGGGRVGIGMTNPQQPLDVQGNIHATWNLMADGNGEFGGGVLTQTNSGFGTNFPMDRVTIDGGDMGFAPTSITYRHIHGRSRNHGLALYGNTGWADGGGILLNGGTNPDNNPGAIDFVCTEAGEVSEAGFSFWRADASGAWMHRIMLIQKEGQVLIGNAPVLSSNDYKLYVETGILTEKVKVANIGTGAWADFVFEEDYSLRSLEEVESYIDENHHLPDVPSAEEVEGNGFDLAEMDAILLRKIEELTLYVIELKKENERLSEKISHGNQ